MITLRVLNIRVDHNLNDFKINLYVYKCYVLIKKRSNLCITFSDIYLIYVLIGKGHEFKLNRSGFYILFILTSIAVSCIQIASYSTVTILILLLLFEKREQKRKS